MTNFTIREELIDTPTTEQIETYEQQARIVRQELTCELSDLLDDYLPAHNPLYFEQTPEGLAALIGSLAEELGRALTDIAPDLAARLAQRFTDETDGDKP